MGTPNIINYKLNCQNCLEFVNFDIECIVGVDNLIKYNFNDTIKWVKNAATQNGGRPENGKGEYEGYGECPSCFSNYLFFILIENDKIVRIKIKSEN